LLFFKDTKVKSLSYGIKENLLGGIDTLQVEIAGMDIYDPIRDEVKSLNREDIAYWGW